MPFLFVDYDQGAGGEPFCADVSKADQCLTLNSAVYANSRTKVLDVFEQEFLKPRPNPKIVTSDPVLYTLVPTHRHTPLAHKLLDKVYSIRIKNPDDPAMWDRLTEKRISRVLLTVEPDAKYFIGLLKIISETATDTNFLKRVKFGMRTVDINLLAQGVEPTEENVNEYLEKIKYNRWPEPEFEYDLIVPYEDLVQDKNKVKQQLKEVFDIDIGSQDNFLSGI